ncbi:unnamed protein product [Arabidopsis halleri]
MESESSALLYFALYVVFSSIFLSSRLCVYKSLKFQGTMLIRMFSVLTCLCLRIPEDEILIVVFSLFMQNVYF